MNYQHFYHAGNHADVFKHLILLALINRFKLKENPFCYLDSHAGNGCYNLTNIKTNHLEWQKGIGLLAKQSANIKHPLLKHYVNSQKKFDNFLGSPSLARMLLRPQDKMILIEKADKPYHDLRRLFYHDPQAHVHQMDAEISLKSLLPFDIKRGLILIDPIYEEINEYEKWRSVLKIALKKFPTACYALWYPIKSRHLVDYFYQTLQRSRSFEGHGLQIIEFCPLPDDVSTRFNGSGMLIVNPPFQFEKHIIPMLAELIGYLKQNPKGFQRCFFL